MKLVADKPFPNTIPFSSFDTNFLIADSLVVVLHAFKILLLHLLRPSSPY